MKETNTAAVLRACETLARPLCESLGLTLWDTRFVKEGAAWYLRYIIDKPGGISMDDCAALSRLLNPALDAADPIEQSYCLEVCSPGVGRELTRPAHFEAYQGKPVTTRLYQPLDGQKTITGVLGVCGKEAVAVGGRVLDRKQIAGICAADDIEINIKGETEENE
ncbi:MAG: ribosome maturation factor RimP [Oscillospiraceae bacterium]|nr:ribosome maturation factor RimP [Oscillospiraceae bacterium]